MKIASYQESENREKYNLKQDYEYIESDCWRWSIWIDASDENLDMIDRVIYNLHYTFPEPVQTMRNRTENFRLTSSGWGVFKIYVRVVFKDDTVLDMERDLELSYPEADDNHAPNSAPA